MSLSFFRASQICLFSFCRCDIASSCPVGGIGDIELEEPECVPQLISREGRFELLVAIEALSSSSISLSHCWSALMIPASRLRKKRVRGIIFLCTSIINFVYSSLMLLLLFLKMSFMSW